MGEPRSAGEGGVLPSERLDSWKEIAAYLRRDVTTVQRWEKREGMPVHRHIHDRLGSVYAFRAELDAWAKRRSLADGGPEAAQGEAQAPVSGELPALPARRRQTFLAVGLFGAALLAAAGIWFVRDRARADEALLADARFQQLTDFEGIEESAAISRDGRFVAFLSDREGRMDVWLTQVGTGQFANLTRGTMPELVNPSVRTLGFSPDGTLVTFWARKPSASGPPEISIWSVPLLGGAPRPYLEGVAEFDWSADGTWLAYHTPGPGDPTFVREPGRAEPRHVLTAPEGLHSHFPLWAPDRSSLLFVHGALPDRLDLWRIPPTGGTPERLTRHETQVSHPVFVDARTLLYLLTDPDGPGRWIQSLDLETGVERRLTSALDRFTSLSASADGRRLVATRATPKTSLWRVPLDEARADMSRAERIPLTTGNSSSPRLGTEALFYVSSTGSGDGLWKLERGVATELWRSPGAQIVGAPAPEPGGQRVAFSVRRTGRGALTLVNADGTGVRTLWGALDIQGTPAWAPDGRGLTVAARVDGIPRLFTVPLVGGAPVPLVTEHSVDPVWSPSGDLVVFSGADVGTTFPLKAVNADGSAHPLSLTLTRGARHLAFVPGTRSVLVLGGEIGHKNLWRLDLDSGAQWPVTTLDADFDLRDFDLSPDGRTLVLEQAKQYSDLVLIDLPRR
ncbi:MAG TPA: DNA-binding protein [Myxococcaceae bacterium]|nr:DNA-binding protein [Myxococcaceae bacterium]